MLEIESSGSARNGYHRGLEPRKKQNHEAHVPFGCDGLSVGGSFRFRLQRAGNRGRRIPPTSVGGSFRFRLQRAGNRGRRIPPTSVGGWFRFRLQTSATGSSRIPPTAVGGLFKLSLLDQTPDSLPNPTHGGGWIVPALPSLVRSSSAYSRLFALVFGRYSAAMLLEPLTDIRFAYQLHYDVCFRTHRRKVLFSDAVRVETFSRTLEEICRRHDFHLLDEAVYPDHIRLVISLRPADTISRTLQTLKGNLSRLLGAEFVVQPPMWADGFLARSVGRVRIEAVKKYIANQAEHHGYERRAILPVFRYRAGRQKVLTAAHSSFDLSHRLVIATRYRRGLFGARIGEELARYWLAVSDKRGFAIDSATVLPDHVHLLVRLLPKQSVESCALTLMNNAQYWYGKHYSALLVKAAVDRLWQPSAYAGTCGELTTALLKSFLGRA